MSEKCPKHFFLTFKRTQKGGKICPVIITEVS